jgi:hypothetical protein
VNFFETSVMIGAYRSSAQIVRAPSVLPAAAPPDVAAAVSPAAALLSAAPPPAALVVLGVDVELEPQAARAMAAIPAKAASRAFLRCMVLTPQTLS